MTEQFWVTLETDEEVVELSSMNIVIIVNVTCLTSPTCTACNFKSLC